MRTLFALVRRHLALRRGMRHHHVGLRGHRLLMMMGVLSVGRGRGLMGDGLVLRRVVHGLLQMLRRDRVPETRDTCYQVPVEIKAIPVKTIVSGQIRSKWKSIGDDLSRKSSASHVVPFPHGIPAPTHAIVRELEVEDRRYT